MVQKHLQHTGKNNGLDMATVDRGFGAIINNAALDATFKVGSLRNIELTAPICMTDDLIHLKKLLNIITAV
jgi:hypothetical protein